MINYKVIVKYYDRTRSSTAKIKKYNIQLMGFLYDLCNNKKNIPVIGDTISLLYVHYTIKDRIFQEDLSKNAIERYSIIFVLKEVFV